MQFAGPAMFTKEVYDWLQSECGIPPPAPQAVDSLCQSTSCPSRERWLEANMSKLRGCGVCATSWQESQQLLENHMCSFDATYCSAANGGSWRNLDFQQHLQSTRQHRSESGKSMHFLPHLSLSPPLRGR